MEENTDIEDKGLKQRHGCVTAWLAFMILVNALIALMYLFSSEDFQMVLPNGISQPVLISLIILAIANVGFAILMLMWRKLGFYGFIITSVCALVLNLHIGIGILQSFFGLIGVGILFGILQIKQGNMSAWQQLK
ncbi:MAG: hypothetical protein WCH34_02785 [Bacteroidota bacterium]